MGQRRVGRRRREIEGRRKVERERENINDLLNEIINCLLKAINKTSNHQR